VRGEGIVRGFRSSEPKCVSPTLKHTKKLNELRSNPLINKKKVRGEGIVRGFRSSEPKCVSPTLKHTKKLNELRSNPLINKKKVRGEGFEPPKTLSHRILSPAHLTRLWDPLVMLWAELGIYKCLVRLALFSSRKVI
jgi:hypothetical protein